MSVSLTKWRPVLGGYVFVTSPRRPLRAGRVVRTWPSGRISVRIAGTRQYMYVDASRIAEHPQNQWTRF